MELFSLNYTLENYELVELGVSLGLDILAGRLGGRWGRRHLDSGLDRVFLTSEVPLGVPSSLKRHYVCL